MLARKRAGIVRIDRSGTVKYVRPPIAADDHERVASVVKYISDRHASYKAEASDFLPQFRSLLHKNKYYLRFERQIISRAIISAIYFEDVKLSFSSANNQFVIAIVINISYGQAMPAHNNYYKPYKS